MNVPTQYSSGRLEKPEWLKDDDRGREWSEVDTRKDWTPEKCTIERDLKTDRRIKRTVIKEDQEIQSRIYYDRGSWMRFWYGDGKHIRRIIEGQHDVLSWDGKGIPGVMFRPLY